MKVSIDTTKWLVIGVFAAVYGLAFADNGHDFGHDNEPRCEHKQHSNWRKDPKERFEEHQTRLHDKLKLSSEQEKAWTVFQNQMKPENKASRPDFESLSKLSTLQRLDKLETLDKERQNDKAQRTAAIRTFYAKLNDAQKKVFDENGFPPPPQHRI